MQVLDFILNSGAIVLLMCASIFFGLAETSIVSTNKILLRGQIKEGRKNASILTELLETPENFLTAILIGNNIVNITISILITVIVLDTYGSGATGLATLISVFLILAFGEITPKAYAARNPDIAYTLAPIVKFLIKVLKPLIIFFTLFANILLRPFNTNTSLREPIFRREDFHNLFEIGEQEGILHKEERQLLGSALDFSNIAANDVMIPMERVVTIDASAALEEAMEIIRKTGFARLPVMEKGRLIGFIHINDVFQHLPNASVSVREISREAITVQPETPVPRLMELLKNKQSSMCFVIDENKKPLGLITVGLLLERIVGELSHIR